MRAIGSLLFLIGLGLFAALPACAHPQVEHALEVVIDPVKVTIVARIAAEQVRLVEWGIEDRESAAERHGEYVLGHLHVKVDGREVAGSVTSATAGAAATTTGSTTNASALGSGAFVFRLEYPLAAAAAVVRIDQDFLREHGGWSASCVVKVRQSDQPTFQTALLTRETSVEFGCEWGKGSGGSVTSTPVAASGVQVRVGPTLWAYFVHGVRHILGGYDHLLFVTALVLAAASLWDLVKVVTAFTVAHTLTLTVSVLNVVHLSDRVVEPMIAASIVFVAVQNVFWPRSSRGWLRLAVAFAFGLFHGLGFAGGLKDAMEGMPSSALAAALVGFSAGVEAGHQVVVIPLFAILWGVRRRGAGSAVRAGEWVTRWGSAGISVAGVFFLVKVVKELY